MKTSLTIDELKSISLKLNLKAKAFVRSNNLKKLNLKIENLSEEELFQYMIKYPEIIERPIIVNENNAVIGRPPNRVLNLL